MAERSYAEKDVALVITCDECHADPGEACWDETGREHVATHPERIVRVRPLILGAVDDVPDG